MKYELGDIVYVSVNPTVTGESTKLQSRFRGPYVVTRIISGDTYEIKPIVPKRNSKHPTTAHVSQLKIYRGSHQDFDEEGMITKENDNSFSDEDSVNDNDVISETDVVTDNEKVTDDISQEAKEMSEARETTVREERREKRQKRLPRHLDDFLVY